jgi:hypothetical protein
MLKRKRGVCALRHFCSFEYKKDRLAVHVEIVVLLPEISGKDYSIGSEEGGVCTHTLSQKPSIGERDRTRAVS